MITEPIFIYDPGDVERFLQKKESFLKGAEEDAIQFGGDVTPFLDKAKAEGHLEWPDVEENEFCAYDSTGLILDLLVSYEPYEHVIIRPNVSGKREPEVLKNILRTFLIATGSPKSVVNQTDLPGLVKMMMPYVPDWSL